eukprot:scaffold30904_cov88-Phaeocystis_antarctica.AAC.1
MRDCAACESRSARRCLRCPRSAGRVRGPRDTRRRVRASQRVHFQLTGEGRQGHSKPETPAPLRSTALEETDLRYRSGHRCRCAPSPSPASCDRPPTAGGKLRSPWHALPATGHARPTASAPPPQGQKE